MKIARIQTHCECQGKLMASVDEAGRVVAGTVRARGGDEEIAPATAMGAGAVQFQVGWLCPLCGRNTVRSFDRGALVFQESERQSASGAAAEEAKTA